MSCADGVERHPVRVLRQVLAHDRDADRVREAALHLPVVRGAPGHGLRVAPRLAQRAVRPVHDERVAAREAPPRVGLVELLAEERVRRDADVPVEAVGEDPLDVVARVDHVAAADEAARVAEAPREELRAGVQEQPRSADPVAAHDDDAPALLVDRARAVLVEDAARPAVGLRRDLADPCPRRERRARRERLRPVRDVDGGLRLARAAEVAAARGNRSRGGRPRRGRGSRCPQATSAIRASRSPVRRLLPASRDRKAGAGAARGAGSRDRRRDPTRPSSDRSGRSTARGPRTGSASRPRRRRGSARGSPTGGSAGSALPSARCCRRPR